MSYFDPYAVTDEIDDQINLLLDDEARDGISYPASVDVTYNTTTNQFHVDVTRADGVEATYLYDHGTKTLTCTWSSDEAPSYEDYAPGSIEALSLGTIGTL